MLVFEGETAAWRFTLSTRARLKLVLFGGCSLFAGLLGLASGGELPISLGIFALTVSLVGFFALVPETSTVLDGAKRRLTISRRWPWDDEPSERVTAFQEIIAIYPKTTDNGEGAFSSEAVVSLANGKTIVLGALHVPAGCTQAEADTYLKTSPEITKLRALVGLRNALTQYPTSFPDLPWQKKT